MFYSIFNQTDIRESLRSRGFITSEPKGTHQRSGSPTSLLTLSPLGTWGVWILILHLDYVASYTDPLLFHFERTYNYYVDNQRLVPWRLCCVGGSKVRSAS